MQHNEMFQNRKHSTIVQNIVPAGFGSQRLDIEHARYYKSPMSDRFINSFISLVTHLSLW